MPSSAQDADAAFFNLMHFYLTAPQKVESLAASGNPFEERRNTARRAFRLKQYIAPGFCWEVPPASAWIEVLCCDLTQGGFSFFLDEKPAFERLVAMFRPTDPIYVAARTNHCRPVLVDAWGNLIDPTVSPARAASSSDQSMESKFLVGCQFLRRFNGV